jgi:predicted acyl esterase
MPEALGRGRWVAETDWPSLRIASRRYVLGPGRLDEAPSAGTSLEWRSPQSVGLAAGDWCSFGEGGAPTDQRIDDAGSLTFDSEPLRERVEILGAPVAVLELAVDRPQALLAVRLNEVLPDGSSVRVTYGLLNLTHHASHEHPEPIQPGRRYRVPLALNQVAHAFAPGSRLRLAVSTAYWPVAWPSAEAVTLTVFTGASELELPVRVPGTDDERATPFEEPESAPRPPYTELRPPRAERIVERDEATRETVITIVAEGGAIGAVGPGRVEGIDLTLEHSIVRRYRIRDEDPLSARAEVVQRMALGRGAWAVRIETSTWLSATAETFEIRGRLDAFEGDALVRSRSWEHSVPRDQV